MDISKYIENGKLALSVKAGYKRNRIVSWNSESKTLKVEIGKKAENGKANIEIIKFFSKLLGKKVMIVKGKTSKNKVIRIMDK